MPLHQTSHYCDSDKELTIQYAASDFGLGAALVQCGEPIAFASHSLTFAERNYAQIEKELVAVVLGSEKFQGYRKYQHDTVNTNCRPHLKDIQATYCNATAQEHYNYSMARVERKVPS